MEQGNQLWTQDCKRTCWQVVTSISLRLGLNPKSYEVVATWAHLLLHELANSILCMRTCVFGSDWRSWQGIMACLILNQVVFCFETVLVEFRRPLRPLPADIYSGLRKRAGPGVQAIHLKKLNIVGYLEWHASSNRGKDLTQFLLASRSVSIQLMLERKLWRTV